jgi:NitT/TauT family transport system substrate-binding protein
MKRSRFIAGGSAALGTVAVCGPAGAQARAVLRLATIPLEVDATGWYALELGYFRANGLDVTVDTFTSGPPITAGIIGGTLDVGVASIGSLSTAHARGLPIVALAPGGIYNGAAPTTVLAVAAASPLRSAKDLAGKTIAVQTLGELGQFTTMSWIDNNGGDSKAVKFLEIPSSAMAEALARGRIDVAFIAEPFYTQAKPAVRFFGAGYDGVSKRFLNTAWLATRDWVERNPAVAKSFVTAMRQAAQWANQRRNLGASGAILAKRTKIPPETIAKMQRAQFALTLDPAMLQPVIDVSARYKVIPQAFPASEIIASVSP